MESMTATEFQQARGVEDWRALGTGAAGWFTAPSLSAGAALVGRIAEIAGDKMPAVDLRPDGVHVRIDASEVAGSARAEVELARSVSAAAQDLGLVADPAALQSVHLLIDTANVESVRSFWQTTTGYERGTENTLADALRRDPPITFHPGQPAPLRNRIHVDVSRVPGAVESAKKAVDQSPYGAFGVTLADADGNEVDLVPGDGLSDDPAAADWQVVFGAMVFYPTTSPAQAAELTTLVAGLAEDAGVPLLVDVRPEGVTIDSGKDQWEQGHREGGHREESADSAVARFVELAGQIQTAAHNLALTADDTRLRFVQLGIDAVDVPAVRAFWTKVLGYRHDPRTSLADIYDPRRLNPVLIFQQMDAAEEDRLQQRNRIRFGLCVPHDRVRARIDTALAAGGHVVADEGPYHCTIADPEGNEVTISAALPAAMG